MKNVAISDLTEINPKTNLSRLTLDDLVSFIPMTDVSESGEWKHKQAAPLRNLRTGFTAFQDGDVLFAKITPCMENGKGAHAVGLENGVGFGSTEFHVLRARSGVLDRFVFHWSQSPDLRVAAEAQMSGSAGQRRVPTDFFGKFLVPGFSPKEQCRIAEILDTVDEAIRTTERLIEKLKALKAGLLHDLLTRGIDENGRLRDPVAHPEEFRVSVLGLIPRDWKVQRLADISNTFAGGTPSRAGSAFFGGGIPWVKSAEVNAPTIFTTEETLSKRGLAASSAEWVRAATPVIAMYGATAGQVAWLAIDATTNQAVLAAPVKNPSTVSRWLYWALVHKTPRLIASVQGSGQPNLSKGIVDSLQLARPGSTHEQSLIAAILDNMDQRLDAEESALGKLRSLKNGLMHDLLTGKVRVPIDEEAEA